MSTLKTQTGANGSRITHGVTLLDRPQAPAQDSAFCRFLYLPTELRYQVYEEYFLEEKNAFACLLWRKSRHRWNVGSRKGKARRCFLPDLCLVSCSFRAESLSLLTKPVTLEISSEDEADAILKMIVASPTHGLRVIQKLAFTDFNNTAMTDQTSA
jgi:hypothetical protein